MRVETGGGTGLKPPDRWCVPLCHDHHLEQHRIGHAAFDKAHMIDLRALAEELASLSPFIGQTDETQKRQVREFLGS